MEATEPVTVDQAAASLGVSPSTVHRRIRSGSLRADRVLRPQGAVWLVHLPADTVTATGEPSPATAAEATAPTGAINSPSQADAMVSLIQTTIATVLGPLVAQLDAQRQDNVRLNDQLTTMAHENGRLSTEVESLRAAEAQQDAILATQAAETPTGSHRHPSCSAGCCGSQSGE